jgi:hypothetical protein
LFYPTYKHIEKRINKHIEPKILEQIKLNNAFIAGGALTCIFQDKEPNDIDIFFKSDNIDYFNVFKMWLNSYGIILSDTDNAITGQYYKNSIQLIKPGCMYGTPEDVISRFDFTICMAAYDPEFVEAGTHLLALDDRFLPDLSSKKLIYNPNSIRPLSTLNRLQKFIDRGYSISGIELIKLGLAINSREIKTNSDLKNEILGIDSVFLKSYLNELSNEEEFNYEKEQARLDKYREEI